MNHQTSKFPMIHAELALTRGKEFTPPSHPLHLHLWEAKRPREGDALLLTEADHTRLAAWLKARTPGDKFLATPVSADRPETSLRNWLEMQADGTIHHVSTGGLFGAREVALYTFNCKQLEQALANPTQH